jgi:putative spermidine/putrescine transport system substrate-binding protein
MAFSRLGNAQFKKEEIMLRKSLGIFLAVVFLVCLYQPAIAGEMVWNLSGGVVSENHWICWVEDFEKATGHNVIHEAGVNFGKLRAMVKSGNVQWDLAEIWSMDTYILGVKEGLFEAIDPKIVRKHEDVIEGSFLPYANVMAYYSTILGYDAELFPKSKGKEPKGWKDFWNVEKFPGPRGLWNSPFNNLEFALIADGVSPDKLYPLDVDRAFRSLDKIKPHVKVWWTSGAQSAQILTDKEVVMTSAWNGRIYTLIEQGAKVDIQWNQGILLNSPVVIPKGAANKKVAMELVNWWAEHPEAQACYANAVGYPGNHAKLHKYVKPELAPYLPTNPDNIRIMIRNNYEWWVANRDKVQERWDEWLLE